MGGALSGIKVLDFGQYIAGPFAAQLLAEQGADVIKVERPEGDPYRHVDGFMVWNRSKKAITLDLKKPEGLKIARDLAKQSDIIIENFKPGMMDKLGVGYEAVKAINPRIVYCSISGFGPRGSYSNIAGYDQLVSALGSVYTEQGFATHPLYLVLPVASLYSAAAAALDITVGLCVREQTGKGQKIDVSMFRVILGTFRQFLVDFEGMYRAPWGPTGPLPLYRPYQCKDGKWLFTGLGNPKFFTLFALALGHDEWLTDPLFEGAPFLIFPPRNAQVMAMIKDIYLTKTREEWIELLRENEIPVAPVQSVGAFMEEPQVIANDMVKTLKQPGVGMVREMGIPVELTETPGKIKGPAPLPGQHTKEILRTLGYRAAQIKELKKAGVVR
ncbi:MAG: CoA transferase [Dehalococcoidia bacterium]|jgi:crotonobetainyl-CoA:carnitine CoA-transferase CaiB-like acyl-CoA transferase